MPSADDGRRPFQGSWNTISSEETKRLVNLHSLYNLREICVEEMTRLQGFVYRIDDGHGERRRRVILRIELVEDVAQLKSR